MDTIPLNLSLLHFCDGKLPLLAFHGDFVPYGKSSLHQPVHQQNNLRQLYFARIILPLEHYEYAYQLFLCRVHTVLTVDFY